MEALGTYTAILFLSFLAVNAAQRDERFELKDITSRYYSNFELEKFVDDFTSGKCSNISRAFSIGKSVLGNDLWVLEISDNPGVDEPEPNFKYVANMHGDETGGRQLLMGLARWLCDNYPVHPKAKKIVEDMHLFLMPTMNPDGYSLGMRWNANFRDLNRNFPDRVRGGVPLIPTGFEEPETMAIINWVTNGSFVASANMHEGALVANYPWDARDDGRSGYAKSPDDSTFIHLSKIYSMSHSEMHFSKEFKGGITNGNAWYPVHGGMQDWNYVAADCMEVTLELSVQKNPPPSTLPKLWADNRKAMLNYALEGAFGGVSGYVKSGRTSQPLVARMHIGGISHDIYSKPTFGDYHRTLAPGVYQITASAKGYSDQTQIVQVPEGLGVGTIANFSLFPGS